MMKIIISFLAVLIAFHCGNNDVKKFASASPQTNIILILADDIGYENITVDGGGSYQTPNLDAMAATGMRYTQAHACPLCSPTRQEMLSGKYNFRNYQLWGLYDTTDPTNKTIANMFSDAGYNTYVAGKWQLGNGEANIRWMGFNSQYIIYEAFIGVDTNELAGNRYKDPDLYTNGAYQRFDGRYGEDVVSDSVISWAAQSQSAGKPFFIYYPMLLCHPNFEPTPDDTSYANFQTGQGTSDTLNYPSMMRYMDKIIGKVRHAIDSLGLSGNTKIIFAGDNGTSTYIHSLYKGQMIRGGKSKTIEYGTHVPLITTGNGNGVDTSLIDFTDFLPTLADMAGIAKPTNYGVLDGRSFFGTSPRRTWIFCQFWKKQRHADSSSMSRWAQTYTKKLYDTLASPEYKKGMFLDFTQYPNEPSTCAIFNMGPTMKKTKDTLQAVISRMHK